MIQPVWLVWMATACRSSHSPCFQPGYVYDPRDMVVCATCRREHEKMARCLIGVVAVNTSSQLPKETKISVTVPTNKLHDICPECIKVVAESITTQLRQMAANEVPVVQQYSVPPQPTRWSVLLLGAIAGAVLSSGITHALPYIVTLLHHWRR